jgi:hypothetical protein
MTLNIDDEMVKSETLIAASKIVISKVNDLFKKDWNYKGMGTVKVDEIIDSYIKTNEFKDFVMAEIKQILAPTIKEVLHTLLSKKIKQYISEEKLNNSDLFSKEEGK